MLCGPAGWLHTGQPQDFWSLRGRVSCREVARVVRTVWPHFQILLSIIGRSFAPGQHFQRKFPRLADADQHA